MRLQRLPCRGPFLGTEPIVFAAYCHRCVPSQTRTCRLLRPWLIVSSFAVLSSRWSYSFIHPSSFIDNKTIQEHLWIHPKSYVRGSAPKSAIDTKVLGSSYLQEVTQCESHRVRDKTLKQQCNLNKIGHHELNREQWSRLNRKVSMIDTITRCN